MHAITIIEKAHEFQVKHGERYESVCEDAGRDVVKILSSPKCKRE